MLLKTPRKAEFSILGTPFKELPFIGKAMVIIDIDPHFAPYSLQFADLIAELHRHVQIPMPFLPVF